MEEIINAAPQGFLSVRKRKYSFEYSKTIRLPNGSFKEVFLKKEHPDIKPLAEKAYAEKELADLRREEKFVAREIRFLSEERKAPAFLISHPGIQRLLSPALQSLPDYAREWSSKSYRKNQKYPEQLKYKTVIDGLLVRSKAEADLVCQFQHYGIPFRYEELMFVGDQELAMDFTLLNVRSGSIYYWDHRGLSDDLQYLKKTHYCEEQYLKKDIIPWVNLIVTTETKDHPLDIQWVNQLIEYYLM